MKTRDELWHDCSRHFSRGEVFERARQNFSGVLFSPNQKLFFIFLPLYLIGGFKGIESRNLKYKKINHNANKNVQTRVLYYLALLSVITVFTIQNIACPSFGRPNL